MVNRNAVNSAAVNAAGGGGTVLELFVEQESFAHSATLELLVEQYSVERASLSLDVEQTSHYPQASLSVQVQQISYAKGTLELFVRQASIALPVGTGDAGDPSSALWRLVVMLDGIDISASMTGDWRVNANAGAARIAEFSMMPAVGPIDPTTWVRKPVTIDYAEVDNTGAVQWQSRLFTGIVDVPEYDLDTRITRFLCTDKHQETLEQSDAAAIQAAIPGSFWSAHVFDAEADGWQRAQDLMSTVQASYDIDSGGTPALTPWAAKATPDYTYTAAGYIHGTRDLQPANSRDLLNRVLIRFDFRFQRLRQRDIYRNWIMSPSVGCEYLQNPFTLPKRAMIRAAAEATGWAVLGITYVDLPPPQHFTCTPAGGGAPYVKYWGYKTVGPLQVPNPLGLLPFCQGAYIKLGKRWAQTVTEEYTVDVRAPQSIGQIGEIASEDYGGVEAAQEIEDWENSLDYDGPTTGAVLHRNGDHVLDADTGVADGRTAMETAIQTLQAIHKTAILDSHRRNFVTWRTLIQPQLELTHTLRLQTTGLTAKGKVVELTHQGSMDTGEATTEVRIALSRTSATGSLGDDPLDAPAAPDSQVDAVEDTTPTLTYGGAGMHIGGTTTAPSFSEDWEGLVTNYQWDPTLVDRFSTDPDLPQTVIYPEQFRIASPAIEEAARQSVEAQQTQIVNVEIPLDELQVA